jgi:hypothetical protein
LSFVNNEPPTKHGDHTATIILRVGEGETSYHDAFRPCLRDSMDSLKTVKDSKESQQIVLFCHKIICRNKMFVAV